MRWLVALFLMTGAAVAQSQQPTQPQNAATTQQQPEAENRGTEQSPIVVKILPTEQAKEKTNNAPKEGIQKWFYGWTLSDKIAAIASFAAALQFIALVVTIGVMRANGRRQLRAYLSIAGTFIENYGTKNALTLNYKIKNHGQTPAFRVNFIFTIDVIATNAVSEFEAPAPEIELKTESTVFPNDTIVGWFNRSVVLTREQAVEIESGRAVIYCWGVMTYRDAFRRRRETKFSYYLGGADFVETQRQLRAGVKNPGPGYLWQFGKDHNQAS